MRTLSYFLLTRFTINGSTLMLLVVPGPCQVHELFAFFAHEQLFTQRPAVPVFVFMNLKAIVISKGSTAVWA